MAGNQFWSSTTVDPKRNFRWVLVFDQIPTFVITKAAKPSFEVSSIGHQYVAHKFNYRGRVSWSPVEVTLVDPVFPDASAKIVKILAASGYAIPGTEADGTISMGKRDAVAAVGVPAILQLDGKGRTVDRWTLHNAWVSKANFGSLDYTSEEMINVTLTFTYDWAEYSGAPASVDNPTPNLILGNGPDQLGTIEKYQEEMGQTVNTSGLNL